MIEKARTGKGLEADKRMSQEEKQEMNLFSAVTSCTSASCWRVLLRGDGLCIESVWHVASIRVVQLAIIKVGDQRQVIVGGVGSIFHMLKALFKTWRIIPNISKRCFCKQCFSDSWLWLALCVRGRRKRWKHLAFWCLSAFMDPDQVLFRPLRKTPFGKHHLLLLGRGLAPLPTNIRHTRVKVPDSTEPGIAGHVPLWHPLMASLPGLIQRFWSHHRYDVTRPGKFSWSCSQ